MNVPIPSTALIGRVAETERVAAPLGRNRSRLAAEIERALDTLDGAGSDGDDRLVNVLPRRM